MASASQHDVVKADDPGAPLESTPVDPEPSSSLWDDEAFNLDVVEDPVDLSPEERLESSPWAHRLYSIDENHNMTPMFPDDPRVGMDSAADENLEMARILLDANYSRSSASIMKIEETNPVGEGCDAPAVSNSSTSASTENGNDKNLADPENQCDSQPHDELLKW